MGAITFRQNNLRGVTSEIVGHKSGLALTDQEFLDLMSDEDKTAWTQNEKSAVRVRSEDFESLVANLLHRVGVITDPSTHSSHIRLYVKYAQVPAKLAILEDILAAFVEAVGAGEDDIGKRIDLTGLVAILRAKHGVDGAHLAREFLDGLVEDQVRSPWSRLRRVEWVDIAELRDLFESESLETYYGKFIDQRFIDFLYSNIDKIDSIHWRKFEALTCEFFDRVGFHVQIGPGRNDGGIDARAWPKKDDPCLPPAILIQCKRQKSLVGHTVVKALWAHVVHERASSGLIVTTTGLSRGAESIRTARGYSVAAAGRTAVRRWIEAMRTPDSGVFMSE